MHWGANQTKSSWSLTGANSGFSGTLDLQAAASRDYGAIASRHQCHQHRRELVAARERHKFEQQHHGRKFGGLGDTGFYVGRSTQRHHDPQRHHHAQQHHGRNPRRRHRRNSSIGGYSAGNHTLSGVIQGPGDFAMSRYTSWNGGSVQTVNIKLTGTASNIYTGKTVVDGQGGVASLNLMKTGGAVAIAPNTIVQMGNNTGGQAKLHGRRSKHGARPSARAAASGTTSSVLAW